MASFHVRTGFGSVEEARELLQRYVANIGLPIDWTRPTTSSEGERVIERYESPDAGLNGFALLTYEGGRVVLLQYSMAL